MKVTIPLQIEVDDKHLENAIDKYMRENPDVVEVVRCKDCINWETGYRYCRRIGVNFNGDSPVGMNDYCSCGERREDTDGT